MCLNFGTCGSGGVLDFETPSPRISPIFGTLPCRVPTFGTALPILPAQVTLCHPQLAATVIADDVKVSAFGQLRDLALDCRATFAAPGLEVGVGGDALAVGTLEAVHLAEQQNRAIGEILVLCDFERDAQVGAGWGGRRLCGIMVVHAAIPSSLAVWRNTRTAL